MNKVEKKNVPELRFPEFKDAEVWDEKLIGDIYDFKVTNSLSRENLNYVNGIVKNIHYGDIHTKFNTLFDITKEIVPYINPDILINKIKEESYCIEGDIIFADASEDLNDIGKSIEIINLNNKKLVSGLHTLLARQKRKILVTGFGGHLFKSYEIRKQIQKEAQGTKILGISISRISSVKVHFPVKSKEQQKIANCLSSLDEVIINQTAKLGALKTYKKGLVQSLFPKEGETIPQYRFPEFTDSPEWVTQALQEAVTLLSGFTFKTAEITENKEGIPILRGINITEGHIRHSKDIDRFYIGNLKSLEKFNLNVNDLVIGMDGSKVGRNVALITNEDIGALLIQRVARLRSKKDISIQFVFYYINSARFHAYVDRINTSSGIPHISSQQILDFHISFPPSYNEQHKVAEFLISIDDQIKGVISIIEQLKIHKKGLMQQLFPNITE